MIAELPHNWMLLAAWIALWAIVTLLRLAYARLRQREVDRWLTREENDAITARADAQHAAWLRWEATRDNPADHDHGLYGNHQP